MSAILEALMTIAAEADALDLPGVAGIIRACAWEQRRHGPAIVAGQLRSFAAEDNRSAEALAAMPEAARLFGLSAALKEKAADALTLHDGSRPDVAPTITIIETSAEVVS